MASFYEKLTGVMSKGQTPTTPAAPSTVPAASGGFYQPANSGANAALLQAMMGRSRAGRNPMAGVPAQMPGAQPAPAMQPAQTQTGGGESSPLEQLLLNLRNLANRGS